MLKAKWTEHAASMLQHNTHEHRGQTSYSGGKIMPLNAQYAIRSLLCPAKINVTHETNLFHYFDMAQHCKEQDIEICALKLSFGTLNICVLTLYRAPSGNFGSFLLKLDTIFQSIIYTQATLHYLWGHKHQFLVNSEMHHIDTRQHANFHQPSVNVTK